MQRTYRLHFRIIKSYRIIFLLFFPDLSAEFTRQLFILFLEHLSKSLAVCKSVLARNNGNGQVAVDKILICMLQPEVVQIILIIHLCIFLEHSGQISRRIPEGLGQAVQRQFFFVVIFHICRYCRKPVEVLVALHRLFIHIRLPVFTHKQIDQHKKLTLHLQLVSHLFTDISLIHLADQPHHLLILNTSAVRKIDKFFVCVILLKCGQWNLQYNCKIFPGRMDGVNLIGIDKHKLSRG